MDNMTMFKALNGTFLKMLVISLTMSFLSVASLSYASENSHWSYSGHAGPNNWSSLSNEYELCGAGHEQSPINITNQVPTGDEKIEFHYSTKVKELLNNGHTIQANVEKGSYITVGDERFELLQFHFHSPSENKVNKSAYAMEMHLFHKSNEGKLAVIGAFLKEGRSNNNYKDIWKYMPLGKNEKVVFERVQINPEKLLPKKRSYYSFAGSLTTPPCSEGVKWMVLKEPVSVSKDEVLQFLSIIGENARPTQERSIFISSNRINHGSNSDSVSRSVNSSVNGSDNGSNKNSGKNLNHISRHREYKEPEGPQAWGDLNSEYVLCGSGKNQSPVNITSTSVKVLDKMVFSYRDTPIEIVNNGHTIQVNYQQGSYMTVGGKQYDLLQFHFHSPGEHQIEGVSAPLEIHLVHKSADGVLAVVGVMFDKGQSNKIISSLWENMPSKKSRKKKIQNAKINAADILPDDQSYYFYNGSLTTPPCSEGVKWFVMQDTNQISISQINQFVRVIGKNARPVQAINNRHLRQSISVGEGLVGVIPGHNSSESANLASRAGVQH